MRKRSWTGSRHSRSSGRSVTGEMQALTLNGIGLTQARIGDEAGALDSYETAVALLSDLGDSHGAGRVLANLGALHLGQGQGDEARAAWHEALERLDPGSREHEQTVQQLLSAG